MSFLTEAKAVKNADPGVRARILLERRIAVSLVNELIASAVLDAMSETDEDVFFVYKVGSKERFGWLKLVYGNDGWDVISDWTTNLDPFITETQKLITMLGA